jgi:hypothetical protein
MSEWLDIMLEEIDRKKKEVQADREQREIRAKKSSTAKKRKSKKSIRSSE